MTFVDFDHIAENVPNFKERWTAAARRGPAFIVIDDLLRPSRQREIFDSFPSPSWAEWQSIGNRLQAEKLSNERIERFPASLATLVHELNSGPMVRLLEEFTGIAGLLPDPHLWGGGLHLTRPGGYLWPHTDFLQGQHPRLKRIINLILYAHERWEPGMGGDFQVWKGGAVAESISPTPGRCVILRTDPVSVHGVSQVRGRLDRKSVALFYYTITSLDGALADSTTGWQLRQTPAGAAVGPFRRRIAAALMWTAVGLRRASIGVSRQAERVMTGRR